MDRIRVSEALDTGSIPVGRTNQQTPKNRHRSNKNPENPLK